MKWGFRGEETGHNFCGLKKSGKSSRSRKKRIALFNVQLVGGH